MNYQLIYDKLIAKCKLRGLDKTKLEFPTEEHHIVPSCLGGSNEESNLVLLTGREHFVAHRLLTKFTRGSDKYKALAAVAAFCMDKDGNRLLNSRQIELARQAQSKRMSELAAQGLHLFQTEELRQATSERVSELATQGLHPFQTEESRHASSERMTELAAQGTHNFQTEEFRQALSERNKIQYTCPVCGKVGKGPAMFRYHFGNCKDYDAALLLIGDRIQIAEDCANSYGVKVHWLAI